MELESVKNTELATLGHESLLLLQGVLQQRKEQLVSELLVVNGDLGRIAIALEYTVEQ